MFFHVSICVETVFFVFLSLFALLSVILTRARYCAENQVSDDNNQKLQMVSAVKKQHQTPMCLKSLLEALGTSVFSPFVFHFIIYN